MKFFIDTANLDDIQEAQQMGVLDGVTTNPTHISKEKGTFEEIIFRICEAVDGPVSAEVVSTQWE
ncbi:MAG: transaldolase family protein, partial [Candidatus Latescibacteria bacterium]|nr:transaldolase family protein [Candidatus Latescibacterota bacterium]